MKPFTRETITHKTNQTVADRYIRNFSRLGQGIFPTQNAPPKYFGFFFKKQNVEFVGKKKRKQIRGFKRQKWVCIALLFYFSLSSKTPSIFVTINVTFGTFSYFRLLSKVETAISQC